MQEKVCSYENGDLWQTIEMEILSRHAFGQRVILENLMVDIFHVSRFAAVWKICVVFQCCRQLHSISKRFLAVFLVTRRESGITFYHLERV